MSAYECRRQPPRAWPVPQPNGMVGMMTFPPNVQSDHWCGEYAVRRPPDAKADWD